MHQMTRALVEHGCPQAFEVPFSCASPSVEDEFPYNVIKIRILGPL